MDNSSSRQPYETNVWDDSNGLLMNDNERSLSSGERGYSSPSPCKVSSHSESPYPPFGTNRTTKTNMKRKTAPQVPWKKPKDMPRRPLSAYNLFFQQERERLINAASPESPKSPPMKQSSNGDSSGDTTSAATSSSDSHPSPSSTKEEHEQDANKIQFSKRRKRRRHVKTLGIGFANLAKTIAASWKELDPETRSIYTSQAAKEKEKYNAAMKVYRAKVKAEQSATKALNMAKAPFASSNTLPPLMSPTLPETATSFHIDPSMHGTTGRGWHTPPQVASNSAQIGSRLDYEEDTLQLEPGCPISPLNHQRLLTSPIIDPERMGGIRSYEEMKSDACGIGASQKDGVPKAGTSIFSSSLQALDSQLDDEAVDFLTQLKFNR